MRLDGRLVVGVFFGSAVLGSSTAGRYVWQEGQSEGGDLRKRKLRFSCSSSSDSTAKPEMMVIKTVQINIDTDSDTFCL